MTHTATLMKPRVYLLVAAGLMAIGALLHLVVVAVGADAYALLGAPDGLVAMVAAGSMRPAVSALLIAALLVVGSTYGFSAAGIGWRLPARRLVLAMCALGLVARGVVLPLVAAWQPSLLSGLCGRCESVNGFVLVTSALCLLVGGAYGAAAVRHG